MNSKRQYVKSIYFIIIALCLSFCLAGCSFVNVNTGDTPNIDNNYNTYTNSSTNNNCNTYNTYTNSSTNVLPQAKKIDKYTFQYWTINNVDGEFHPGDAVSCNIEPENLTANYYNNSASNEILVCLLVVLIVLVIAIAFSSAFSSGDNGIAIGGCLVVAGFFAIICFVSYSNALLMVLPGVETAIIS